MLIRPKIETIWNQVALYPEDKFFASSNTFGVVDGYSPCYVGSPKLINRKTIGQHIVNTIVVKMLMADLHMSLEEIILQDISPAVTLLQTEEDRGGASFAFAQMTDNYLHICQGGDVVAICETRDGNIIISPNLYYDLDQETEVAFNKVFEKTQDKNEAHRASNEILKSIRAIHANNHKSERGYPIINGDLNIHRLWYRNNLRIEDVLNVILMSDGAVPLMINHPEERKKLVENVVSIFHDRGMKGILEWTASLKGKTAYEEIPKEATILTATF